MPTGSAAAPPVVHAADDAGHSSLERKYGYDTYRIEAYGLSMSLSM